MENCHFCQKSHRVRFIRESKLESECSGCEHCSGSCQIEPKRKELLLMTDVARVRFTSCQGIV